MFEIIANITFHYDAHAWQSANDANIDKLWGYCKEMLFYFSEKVAMARSGIMIWYRSGLWLCQNNSSKLRNFFKMELFNMLELPLLIEYPENPWFIKR
jgi:hypothetical protein